MLCNFHTFNQSLEEGKLPADCIGALVKLGNIENLQVLAKVHGLEDKPFALVIWNHQRDLSVAPKDATNRWVLTERHGAICMPMVKLGNAMPTFPSEPKVLKTSDVTAENLHTVRFSVRKELVPTEWAIARKDPAKYVQQLLPAKGQVRCYSWKELYVDNKLMLTGYAKCSQDCATQLLKQAGDKGIFVELLSCDNTARKPVEWIARLHDEEIKAQRTFAESLLCAKQKTCPWHADEAMAAA